MPCLGENAFEWNLRHPDGAAEEFWFEGTRFARCPSETLSSSEAANTLFVSPGMHGRTLVTTTPGGLDACTQPHRHNRSTEDLSCRHFQNSTSRRRLFF